LEVSLVNKILKVSSKGSIVDGEMTHLIMESAVLPRSGSLRVLREWSTWTPNPKLVFDGIKHMVNENPEWNKVGLFSAIFVRVRRASGWLTDIGGVMVWVLFLRGTVASVSSP